MTTLGRGLESLIPPQNGHGGEGDAGTISQGNVPAAHYYSPQDSDTTPLLEDNPHGIAQPPAIISSQADPTPLTDSTGTSSEPQSNSLSKG